RLHGGGGARGGVGDDLDRRLAPGEVVGEAGGHDDAGGDRPGADVTAQLALRAGVRHLQALGGVEVLDDRPGGGRAVGVEDGDRHVVLLAEDRADQHDDQDREHEAEEQERAVAGRPPQLVGRQLGDRPAGAGCGRGGGARVGRWRRRPVGAGGGDHQPAPTRRGSAQAATPPVTTAQASSAAIWGTTAPTSPRPADRSAKARSAWPIGVSSATRPNPSGIEPMGMKAPPTMAKAKPIIEASTSADWSVRARAAISPAMPATASEAARTTATTPTGGPQSAPRAKVVTAQMTHRLVMPMTTTLRPLPATSVPSRTGPARMRSSSRTRFSASRSRATLPIDRNRNSSPIDGPK